MQIRFKFNSEINLLNLLFTIQIESFAYKLYYSTTIYYYMMRYPLLSDKPLENI